MILDRNWTATTDTHTWFLRHSGSRVYFEVLAPDGSRITYNEVDADQYFTEERRGGATNFQDDVRQYAPEMIDELESLLRPRKK